MGTGALFVRNSTSKTLSSSSIVLRILTPPRRMLRVLYPTGNNPFGRRLCKIFSNSWADVPMGTSARWEYMPMENEPPVIVRLMRSCCFSVTPYWLASHDSTRYLLEAMPPSSSWADQLTLRESHPVISILQRIGLEGLVAWGVTPTNGDPRIWLAL